MDFQNRKRAKPCVDDDENSRKKKAKKDCFSFKSWSLTTDLEVTINIKPFWIRLDMQDSREDDKISDVDKELFDLEKKCVIFQIPEAVKAGSQKSSSQSCKVLQDLQCTYISLSSISCVHAA